MVDSNLLQVYHPFSSYRIGAPWKVLGTVYKPKTKGFTALSVQFEDSTEVSDVEVVILATGYNYRFPFLDPSDPYNQPSMTLPTDGRTWTSTKEWGTCPLWECMLRAATESRIVQCRS